MAMSSAVLSNFLGHDKQLSSIVERVNSLNQVLGVVRSAVPPELSPLCMGVAWSGATLFVALPHSAAAARLRLCAPTILQKLQEAGWQATAIRPQVQVALQREKPILSRQLTMSDAAQTAFTELEQEVEDQGLKSAIQALLRHHRRDR